MSRLYLSFQHHHLPDYTTHTKMRNGQKSVLVINGPNLNLLGVREPHIYGSETLEDVMTAGRKQAQAAGAHIDFFQR